MSDQALVSVVMPCFNAASFISRAIESVLEQSWANLELIVVDDASSDDSRSIIKRYIAQDERVRLIGREVNGGAAAARNMAIDAARGRYLAFLDSDDLWKPNKLEMQIAEMNAHCAGWSCTGYLVRRNDKSSRLVVPLEIVTERQILAGFAPGCPTVMLDLKLIGEKLYMPLIPMAEDVALWIIILRKIGFGIGVQNNLTIVNDIYDSLSSRKLRVARHRWAMYRGELELSFLTAAYYFMRYSINGIRRHWL